MASISRFIESRLRLKVDTLMMYRERRRAAPYVTRSAQGLCVRAKRRADLHAAKSAVAKPEERHFVGFRLRCEPLTGEVEVLLSKRTKGRIDEKVVELTPRNWGQSLKDCIRRVNAYLLGWLGFFWICSAAEEQTLHNLDAHIRRRLRALLLRKWKRKRFIARRLIKLGVKPKTAWRSTYKGHRSLWALSSRWGSPSVPVGLRGTAATPSSIEQDSSWASATLVSLVRSISLARSIHWLSRRLRAKYSTAVDRGLRNAYFAKRGLVSIEERWRDIWARFVTAPTQLELALG